MLFTNYKYISLPNTSYPLPCRKMNHYVVLSHVKISILCSIPFAYLLVLNPYKSINWPIDFIVSNFLLPSFDLWEFITCYIFLWWLFLDQKLLHLKSKSLLWFVGHCGVYYVRSQSKLFFLINLIFYLGENKPQKF